MPKEDLNKPTPFKNAKEGYDENFDFDELDKEVGLGDLLNERDSMTKNIIKNIVFIGGLLAIGVFVFWASFKLGEKIFFVDKSNVLTKEFPKEEFIESAPAAIEETIEPAKLTPTPVESTDASSPASEMSEVKPDVKPVVKAVLGTSSTAAISKKLQPSKVITSKPTLVVAPKITSPAKAAPLIVPIKPVPQLVPKTTPVKKQVATKPTIVHPKATPAPAIAKPIAAKPVSPVISPIVSTHTPETGIKNYKVIAGSFKNPAMAEKFYTDLKAKHIDSTVTMLTTSKGSFHRVIAGEFNSMAAARERMKELKQLGYDSFVY